jgi:GntR family transcriptional regulator
MIIARVNQGDRTITRIENVPLTERARASIFEAIMERRFDERLPSEEALADMLNVSRTTIRTALQSLEQDGIITRKRAIGTTINAHVRTSSLALQRMVGFDGLLREKGYDVKVKIDWERGPVGAEIAMAFGLPPDQDSLLTEKRYFADGALAIYIRDGVPWSNLKLVDFDEDVPASIFEFSGQAWTQRVDHAIADIVPMVKRAKNTTKLPIQRGDPFIRLHERHYTSRGELLAVSIVDVDNRFFHFEVFRRR